MINFALPGMYEHYEVIIPLCSLFKIYPHFFYDNININAVFGNFQFCCWDGGRIFNNISYKHASIEDILRLKEIYNNILEIPMRLIFTTALTEPDLCHSYYDNTVAHLCEDEMNEIVVASPVLEEYLRINYPKYSFIASTTKCISSAEEAKEELERYKMCCIDYNLNKNTTFLNSLKSEEKDKVEFLVNAICAPGCPTRKQHYYLNSLYNYSYGVPYNLPQCSIKKNNLYPHNYVNNLTHDDIIKYHQLGFSNFKLEGRTFPMIKLILTLVPYLIKPEYQFYIIDCLIDMAENFNLEKYSLKEFKESVII